MIKIEITAKEAGVGFINSTASEQVEFLNSASSEICNNWQKCGWERQAEFIAERDLLSENSRQMIRELYKAIE